MSKVEKKCPLCGFPLSAVVRVCVGPHPLAVVVTFPKPAPKKPGSAT